MENTEPLKFGHEPEGLCKRRISSILKAPRTSMKVCGVDNDEQEETRPIEKRRNSRRVSFATTNNVHLFSKDIKGESPVLAPIQNVTIVGVNDELDKKKLQFATSETGLDTMLKIPLHITQLSKGNFFPDPVLPYEPVDRTILLGEDTGYMDMTQSHTITIDNEVGMNPEFSFSVVENVAGLQDGVRSKTTVHKEGAMVQSDFSSFLASISNPAPQNAQNTVTSRKKCNLFRLEDATKIDVDKENLLPSRITKNVPSTSDAASSQQKVLQPRSYTASFLDQENMDMTQSHTVVIDRREAAHHVAYPVCGNPKSTVLTQSFFNDLEDMEITRVHTTTINVKDIHSKPLVVVDSSSHSASDDTNRMVMTQVLDGFLQEEEKKEATDNVPIFPQAHRSFFNHSQNMNITDLSKIDPFQSNTSKATMTFSDDMEITQANTVFLDFKREEFSKSRNDSSFVPQSSRINESGRLQIAPKLTRYVQQSVVERKPNENKKHTGTTEDTIFFNDQSDFMELTCQPNASVMVMSSSADDMDMELTGCNNVTIDAENILPTSGAKLRKRTYSMPLSTVSVETKKVDLVQDDFSVAYMDDEMEMVQCQTVVLESEHCEEQTPFSNSRKMLFLSGSCRRDIGSRDYKEMDNKLAVHTEQSRSSDFKKEAESRVVRQANTFYQDLSEDCMEKSATQVDMDLTGCKTIAIDTKSNSFACASNIVTQKRPSVLPSRPVVLGKDQMETSEVHEKPEQVLYSQSKDCTSCSVAAIDVDPRSPVVSQKKVSSCLADMCMDKDQAVVTDLNHISKEGSSLCLTDGNAEPSENDCDMELTKAMTVPLEEQCCFALKQGGEMQENAESLSGTTDQSMDHALLGNQVLNPIITEGFAVESKVCVKQDKVNSSKSRRRSLADLQAKLQNIAQCINEPADLMVRSYTTPIPQLTDFDTCPSELSERDTSTELYKGTPTLNTASSANTDTTTPFNLKSFLTARLSIGGITPKLPSWPKSASPNQTEPISAYRPQSLPSEADMDGDTQNSKNVMNIENEVFPDEDFSDNVISYLDNNKDEPDGSAPAPLGEGAAEANEIESLSEMSTCETEDAAEGEPMWSSNLPAAGIPSALSHLTKVIENTSSSGISTNIKFEGISESTLRNSQFDSQIDGTLEHEFDFNKTLADRSITVNEFLSHFGANSVIHKSRPSALPDNFRVAQTNTMVDLLKEKYIFRPKQRVYEADCQKLQEVAEGYKMQMTEQDKPLRDVSSAVIQDVCAFSSVQLQEFGGKLKERRGNFRKKSKALSHEIKAVLYSELCKTTRESKHNLLAKITETSELLKDLDGCINDLESELASVSSELMGNQHSLSEEESSLKAKQRELGVRYSEVAETERQICDLELQRVSLEGLLENQRGAVREFENRITTLNSLNEWQFCESDENVAVFTFLHNTVNLEVKLKHPSERGWMCDDVEQDVDISFRFRPNGGTSQTHAHMVHTLLGEHIKAQPTWMQKYPTTRHIPVLLHDVSLVVSRLRLLGEEIHQLKNWGGLRLGILHINCVDTLVEIVFSSIKAYVKFELSLTLTPDYPLNPLQMQKFQNHIGKTRVDQIEDVLCSVTPAKNYLTNIIKKIHSNLL